MVKASGDFHYDNGGRTQMAVTIRAFMRRLTMRKLMNMGREYVFGLLLKVAPVVRQRQLMPIMLSAECSKTQLDLIILISKTRGQIFSFSRKGSKNKCCPASQETTAAKPRRKPTREV